MIQSLSFCNQYPLVIYIRLIYLIEFLFLIVYYLKTVLCEISHTYQS